MPNWCECELTISGPDVQKILAAIRGDAYQDDEAKILDFDKIIPYPLEFKELDRRNQEYEQKFRAIAPDDVERTSKLETPASEYGVEPGTPWLKDGFNSGGYEWCCAHWGTKWNASHPCLAIETTSKVRIDFDTAWTPPLPVIECLATLFPDHEFDLKYFECGAGFCGHARWKKGVERYHHQSEYRGRRGG